MFAAAGARWSESGVSLSVFTALWLDSAGRPSPIPYLLSMDGSQFRVLRTPYVPVVLHWPVVLGQLAFPADCALLCACDFNGHYSLRAGCVPVRNSSQ